MQKKERQRNIVIGIVVAALFFGWWLRGFLYSNWHFRLFSRRSWSYIANEFESGWMLNAKSDWIFLCTILLSIPAFLYLWYLCTKIRWRKLIKKIWKWLVALCLIIAAWFTYKKQKTKKQKKTTLAPPPPPVSTIKKSSTNTRPKPLEYSPQLRSTQPIITASEETAPTFTKNEPITTPELHPDSGLSEQQDLTADDIADIPLEDIQLPEREPVVEDIPALFTNAGYTLLSDIKTSHGTLDFMAIGAKTIYAIIMDRETGDWLAEEEPFNDEAPLWFSEVDHRVSPIYELRQTVRDLQEKVSASTPDKQVIPFMIEEKGNIINTEEMLGIWKELGVIVSRTDIGGTEDLPTTAQVIENTQPASAADIDKLTTLFKGEK